MPKAFQTVGAIIDRPRSEMFCIRLSTGEFVTLCRRAIDNRPYDIIFKLRFKLQFIFLFIKMSFFIYVSFMERSKPKTILITERLRKP